MEYTPISYAIPTPNAIFADCIQPLMGLIHLAVYYPLFVSHPPIPMITTSIGYDRKLSNLAKIYTNDAKYSG